MTDIIIVEAPQVRVVFPQNFSQARFSGQEQIIPSGDVLRSGDSLDTISDDVMLERVANYFDFPVDDMRQMQVSRPSEGRILISAKFSYG